MYHNKTVLITGASSGIGATFAHTFARQGANLILVARSADKLQQLAADLTRQHRVKTLVIPTDLTRPEAAKAVYDYTAQAGWIVDVLVNNAGFAAHGYFDQLSLERQREEIMLNIGAVVELTHLFIQGMVERGSGAILNVSSTSALQPVPYMAVYGATKAFVLSFSQALWEENRKRGIEVLALCPGATDTAFFDVVGAQEASVGSRATPEAVVQVALHALERKQSMVIEGRMNNLLAVLPRLLPRQIAVRIVASMVQPRGV
jgi:short-subunit dehydrogenase